MESTVTLSWSNEPTYQSVFGKPTSQRNAEKVKKEVIEYLQLFGIPATDENTKIEQKRGESSPDYTGKGGRTFTQEINRGGWYTYNVEYTSEQGYSIAVCSVDYHKNTGAIIRDDCISWNSGGIIQ